MSYFPFIHFCAGKRQRIKELILLSHVVTIYRIQNYKITKEPTNLPTTKQRNIELYTLRLPVKF